MKSTRLTALTRSAPNGNGRAEIAYPLDSFPAQQRGMAMSIYGVAIVVAPILGPVVGGYISDNYT